MQLSETGAAPSAARKRAAVELIARDGAELRRTARRYSLCEEDAEDACQRALEILLLKAPSERPRELIRWTKTVIKHEALAIRRNRERLLGSPPPGAAADEDPTASIPAAGEGPEARVESREHIARSREALRTLKPAELRALTLLAAGYSYAEIGEITGFSQTKVNRCLAEGRERFRGFLAGSEDGSRCVEMAPLLSAFCDGEVGAEDAATVREHLRACVACRAALRAYRATPSAVAALAPALPAARPLLERARELFHDLAARLPGGGGADAGVVVAGGASGAGAAGAAGAAKLLAVCAGAAGAACVATGVAPAPLDLVPEQRREPRIERVAEQLLPASPEPTGEAGPAPAPTETAPAPQPEEAQPALAEAAPTSGAVEYEPSPPPVAEAEPAPTPPASSPPTPTGPTSGSAAGEFGP